MPRTWEEKPFEEPGGEFSGEEKAVFEEVLRISGSSSEACPHINKIKNTVAGTLCPVAGLGTVPRTGNAAAAAAAIAATTTKAEK
jgi:hypothetical protein